MSGCIENDKNKKNYFINNSWEFFRYPVAGGIFLALAFPRFDVWIFAWIALVPILLHISRAQTLREGFFSGFVFGLIFFGILLYWLPRTMVSYGGIGYVLAILAFVLSCAILAVFFGIFTIVQTLFFKAWGWKSFLLAPFTWTSLEYARNWLAVTGFPWGTLGTSQAYFGYMIQISDISGVYGVSFLLVAVNTVAFLALMKDVPKKLKLAWASMVGMTLLYCFLYAEVRYMTFPVNNSHPIKIGAIQGNIAENFTWQQIVSAHIDEYPNLLDKLMKENPNTKIVVFPENPAPLSYEKQPVYRKTLSLMASTHSVVLFVNGIHYKAPSIYYNAVYCIGKNGKLKSIYDKMHLVPFAENVPFQKIFFFVKSLSKEISNFKSGTRWTIHRVGNTKIGVFICYEAIFPNLVRGFTSRGAQLLINVTNDGWFGHTAAPWQHFQNIILRAVENRRWILRAANTGISAIIDPLGRVTDVIPPFKKGLLIGTVYPENQKSIYVIIGDLFSWLCIVVTIIFIILLYFKGRKTKYDS